MNVVEQQVVPYARVRMLLADLFGAHLSRVPLGHVPSHAAYPPRRGPRNVRAAKLAPILTRKHA